MENNKILIGVQFTQKIDEKKRMSYNIELYVLRDIKFSQLMIGIEQGLAKMAKEDLANKDIYDICMAVYSACLVKKAKNEQGREYYSHIKLTSCFLRDDTTDKDEYRIFIDEDKPICDLGFVNATRIIFDETGVIKPRGRQNISRIIDAFHPEKEEEIVYPEYNISTRMLWRFDQSPVSIIPPSDPPKKAEGSLISLLMPTLISVGVMMGFSAAFMTGGYGMVAMIPALITTVINWNKQKKKYAKDLADWKNHYQDYINKLIVAIKARQEADAVKMDQLYPDVTTLVEDDGNGMFSLNDNIYSRSENDEDFLTFRIGTSNQVPSKFEIRGEKKDVVFSQASYTLEDDRLHMFIGDETEGDKKDTADGVKANLSDLPYNLSEKYRFLKNAPLLYSLKHNSSLGIVDRNIDKDLKSKGTDVISRMIVELCYYHSPDKLQFVMFFNKETGWLNIEKAIGKYKFMPHFRGLFEDKSQFVFDEEGAHGVLNALLQTAESRASVKQDEEQGQASPMPHIVFIIFDDHGIKEHAFSEYLPKVPEKEKQGNKLGMSFVFVKKYKEYLPEYCDNIIDFTGNKSVIIPHDNVNGEKIFTYSLNKQDFTVKSAAAIAFLSSIYYAKNAEASKVPSSVSYFELHDLTTDTLESRIRANWGFETQRAVAPVTKNLKTPIGKTDSGLAYWDLHERGDGPHALISGTTGSGKSETVIAYLLGLCMQFRPDELNLLLVDMKGGGFTERLGDLPHVVGKVTDVDNVESGTSPVYMLKNFLQSMRAESQKRKVLFKKLKVDNIDDYIRAWDNIDEHISNKGIDRREIEYLQKTMKNPKLSHLILVVDEFTELKRFSSENDDVDFIKEITTIARTGRSLGLHIILVSQNIEGAITDDIRVNSKSRLCLKVATKQASKEMLGSEVAANPAMPGNGRAYLMVGTGSRLDYFQSGYTGIKVGEEIPLEITYARKNSRYTRFNKGNETIYISYDKDEDCLKAFDSMYECKKHVSNIAKWDCFSWGKFRSHQISVLIRDAASYKSFVKNLDIQGLKWEKNQKASSFSYDEFSRTNKIFYIFCKKDGTLGWDHIIENHKRYTPHIIDWVYSNADTDKHINWNSLKNDGSGHEGFKAEYISESKFDSSIFKDNKFAVQISDNYSYNDFMVALEKRNMVWAGKKKATEVAFDRAVENGKSGETDKEAPTQLQAVINAVNKVFRDASRKNAVDTPDIVFHAPLPVNIAFTDGKVQTYKDSEGWKEWKDW